MADALVKEMDIKSCGPRCEGLIDRGKVLDKVRDFLQKAPIDAELANEIYEIIYSEPTVLEANQ